MGFKINPFWANEQEGLDRALNFYLTFACKEMPLKKSQQGEIFPLCLGMTVRLS